MAALNKQGACGGPIVPPNPGREGDCGVHHQVGGRRTAEIHAERWRAPLWYFHHYCWLRLTWQAGAVPDGSIRHLLCLEGQRHRAKLQNCKAACFPASLILLTNFVGLQVVSMNNVLQTVLDLLQTVSI